MVGHWSQCVFGASTVAAFRLVECAGVDGHWPMLDVHPGLDCCYELGEDGQLGTQGLLFRALFLQPAGWRVVLPPKCCLRPLPSLQLVSGAHPTAYWLANFCWDLVNYCVPAAGIVLLVYWYHQPQLSGIRLVAMAVLLLAFGGAGINLTYLTHFLFVVSFVGSPSVKMHQHALPASISKSRSSRHLSPPSTALHRVCSLASAAALLWHQHHSRAHNANGLCECKTVTCSTCGVRFV